ncbi:MAG: NAD(P)-dependent oxidoreductase [Gemmataceae bacterium]
MLIVIPGDDPPQLQGSPHLDRLKQHAEVVVYSDRPATAEEKVRRVRDADCMINSRSAVKWPGDILAQLPRLKMISVCGIGTDAIDPGMAKERGILVCNIPGCTAPIVAEHTLGLMLAVARRMAYHTLELKQHRWHRLQSVALAGRMLGLVGAGSIAIETARLARAIGMRVQAWTFNPDPERSNAMGCPFVSLDELLQTSDVVSLHVKLTERSRHLIGARELGLMKKGALLINTARGAIVDVHALRAALESGHVGGAGIDVYEVEPMLPDYPLLDCDQVVLTPHNADDTPEGNDLLNQGAVDNVLAYLAGRPRNVVG